MSNTKDVVDAHETCDASRKQFEGFYQKLVKHSQFTQVRQFETGSLAEIALNENSIRKICPGKAPDLDVMTYSIYWFAFSPKQRVPESYSHHIITYHTEGAHPGYARLVLESEGRELLHSDVWTDKFKNFESKHGPARLIMQKQARLAKHALPEQYAVSYILEECDNVHSVHSPYWPAEASEWVSRKRTSGVPSKSVIKKVVQYGCDFVAIAHKHSSNTDNEWRFSFSMAEKIIINSLTRSQRIVYRVLRILCKICQNEESQLCSYFFKTIVLRVSEAKSELFWTKNTLFQITQYVMLEMIKCLKSRHCPNYFIPSNNIMDALNVGLLESELNSLVQICFLENHIAEIIKVCSVEEDCSRDLNTQTDLPAWLASSLMLFDCIVDRRDTYSSLLCENFSIHQQNSIQNELFNVYEGLKRQHEAARCTTQGARDQLNAAAEMYLNHCAAMESSRALVDNDSSLIQIIGSNFIKFKLEQVEQTKDETPHSSQNATLSSYTDLSSEIGDDTVSNDKLENSNANEHSDEYSISVSTKYNNDYVYDCKAWYKSWPGVSPTVKISWFISKVYLANLYYTTKKDYNAAITVCLDMLATSQLSECNKHFAEVTLPVILSTEWIGIFDMEIQTILGFYSLSSYVLNGNASVYYGVCPVQFILYLTVSCLIHLEGTSSNKMKIYSIMYMKHLKECRCDDKVNNGRHVLTAAIARFCDSRALEAQSQLLSDVLVPLLSKIGP